MAICAFNERHLRQTVKSVLENSSGRNDIIVSICEFRTDNKFADFSESNVVHYKYTSSIPTGVGVARSMALRNSHLCDYVLQLDAHMMLGEEWDVHLINRYMGIVKQEGECVITQHLPSCFDDGNGKMVKDLNANHLQTPVRLFVNKEMKTWSEPWHKTNTDWYKENQAVSAAFMFSASNTFTVVPPDPLVFFFGEEHTLFMRLACRGIRSFSTDYCDVRHFDKGKLFYEDEEIKDWRVFVFNKSRPEVELFERFSTKRAGMIMLGQITGLWGATSKTKALIILEQMGITQKAIKSAFGL